MSAPRRPGPVTSVQMTALRPDGRIVAVPDDLVTEEPLELRVAIPGGAPETVTTTMRTPGHDFELAAGYLLAEGVIAGLADIDTIRYCDLSAGDEQAFNVVTVHVSRDIDVAAYRRLAPATASCGVCGTASLDRFQLRCPPIASGLHVPREVLIGLPATLRSAQAVFDRTGGLHAAGLFGADGHLVLLREDVGRHNALDKLIGRRLLDGAVPLGEQVLVLSGRVSFELVQKAAVAGIPVICAVSAPSSLAVETAKRLGITLVGFVRHGGANVYAHPARVIDL